jgi:hypothetical protein
MDTSPPLEKRTWFQQAFSQMLGISFLVLFVVLGCHLWNTPTLTSIPTVTVTRTVPTATYWFYRWSRGMELVMITDGAATQAPCPKGIVGRFETAQCTLRFADGTVVPWMVHSTSNDGWVEVHGRRYPLYGRGYVLLIRANGAEGESTMVHRATMPVFPAGAEGPALEAWMATDPLLAPLAPAFATEP